MSVLCIKNCYYYYPYIFPGIWVQHCNYATLLAGRSVTLIYGIISSSRCALLLLGGVLNAFQLLRLGGDSGCSGLSITSRACLALVNKVARGCLSFIFVVIVCKQTLGKSSVVFLTDEFQRCLLECVLVIKISCPQFIIHIF